MSHKRLLVAAALVAGAVPIVFATSGSAQAPGGRTITFFEDEPHGSFGFVDNPPKSPVRNPESRRFRLSVGDVVFFSNPILDRRGGTRIGRFYGEGTMVRGTSFRNGVFLGRGVASLRDGQIVVEGAFRSTPTNVAAVVGGTAAYAGGRGTFSTIEGRGGSQDTVTLLP